VQALPPSFLVPCSSLLFFSLYFNGYDYGHVYNHVYDHGHVNAYDHVNAYGYIYSGRSGPVPLPYIFGPYGLYNTSRVDNYNLSSVTKSMLTFLSSHL
jgi:hypothetical protein